VASVSNVVAMASALALLASCSTSAVAQNVQPSTRDLDRILGTWSFDDASAADNGASYRETGTRTCALTLSDTYIRCESLGRAANGTERTYLFYFNYNAVDRRYEMLSLHSSWSQSQRFELRIMPDGNWHLHRGATPSADGRVNRSNWGVVRFPDANTMIWETRLNRNDEPPDRWTLSYIDTARRIR
jgi:hypothetical protein